MKIKGSIFLIVGLIFGYSYSEYKEANKQTQVYNARDLQSDIKKEVSRVNIILDETEKKHIKKTNVPKPSPPSPEIICKCNGEEVIVQPDGNKVQCQCFKDGGTCKCKAKQQPELIQPQLQSTQVNP